MCTRPLSVPRYKYGNVFSHIDQVPCGKCPECLLRKQAEFACLAVLQAEHAKSVDFFTMTYSNAHLPIMRSDVYPVDNLSFDCSPQAHKNCLLPNHEMMCATDGNTNWTPSLRREDVKLAIKSARQAYLRKYGKLPEFTYAGFGEYG